MRILVPFDARTPKTRLSPVLGEDEREQFATAMLDDVLAVLRDAGHDPELLSTAPLDCGLPVTVDERPLTTAINEQLAAATPPLGIVMADLALVTTDALERLSSPDADVVLAPGIGGGTNAVVVRHPEFRVDYHGTSFLDHLDRAGAIDASVATVDSFRLTLDIDEPADLVELFLHGDGRALRWLQSAGFELAEREGRTIVTQSGESE
jgi:2-phospho-L-lactate guanylyltransferase